MAKLRTPDDLGNIIRQRRRMLAWDQAKLALEVGVSRRWIIEIEKGKPRAELHLVLRTLNVLGIGLDATPFEASSDGPDASPSRIVIPDINRVIERNKAPDTDSAWSRYPMTSGPASRLQDRAVNEPTRRFATGVDQGTASDAVSQIVQAWLEHSSAPGKPLRKKK